MAGSPPFKAVVFDMDGLLLDSERPTRAAWRAAAAAFGVPLSEEEYLSVVGLNHAASAARMLGWFGGDAARFAAAGAQAAAALSNGPPFDPKPGARRLLETLAEARIPCAVASSTHRAEVERRLTRAGLLGHFSALCGGDEVVHGKPAPDLYLLALQRLGATPATSLAFEDSGHGVQAALAAGLATVAVPDLKAPSPEWLSRCLAVLPSLDAVGARSPEWFGVLRAT